MNRLFKIKDIEFYQEDFQDDIREFEDLIPLIQEFQTDLDIQKIQCAEDNDCCGKTRYNYIAEMIGAITENDDFYTLKEIRANNEEFKNQMLHPFGIQIYKCLNCGKWIINILE